MSAHHNVDAGEIAKFEALAQRWWDRQGEFKPLHDLNPVRLGFIEEHLSLTGTRVLDVGCGGGILSEAMARRGARVVGIDLAQAALEVAQLAVERLDLGHDLGDRAAICDENRVRRPLRSATPAGIPGDEPL